ncbi:hypothetical protein FNV43_RR21719 [Rhamnella rubrinervis]|uniref:Uncharacterized protein n=1 Tax=Rhamnella rubrinervis TaxID=2594499 RepID=A0A8K0GQD9_9ROSA|nr:hypothetical protein FNV43_RR21719 [Rhamnella rubrinervis]
MPMQRRLAAHQKPRFTRLLHECSASALVLRHSARRIQCRYANTFSSEHVDNSSSDIEAYEYEDNSCFKELNSGLHSRIKFSKNQPAADRSYKNLLKKADKYFSHEALFGEESSTHPSMTMEGMKEKFSEMKKSGAGEKRGNDGSEGYSIRLPPAPAQLSSSGSSVLHTQIPSTNIPTVQTLEGSSSFISVFIPPKLSHLVKYSMKLLSLTVINEMETIPSDIQASLLTTLEVKVGFLDWVYSAKATGYYGSPMLGGH